MARPGFLRFAFHKLSVGRTFRDVVGKASRFMGRLTVTVAAIIFGQDTLLFTKRSNITTISVVVCLRFLYVKVCFKFSVKLSAPLKCTCKSEGFSIYHILRGCTCHFFSVTPVVLCKYACLLTPVKMHFFTSPNDAIFSVTISNLHLCKLKFLFSKVGVFTTVHVVACNGKCVSNVVAFLHSFTLLLLFLAVLPEFLRLGKV